MQPYENYTKDELLSKMTSLERLNAELFQTLQEIERLEFKWTGNLGQWFWDFETNEVTFNPLKAETIGYMEEDLPEKVNFQFFTDKIHPDDYEDVMQQMRSHLSGDIPVWEVKYRIQAKDGSWKMYHDRGKVTQRTEDGKPLFLTGIVFDITDEEKERAQLKAENETLSDQVKKDELTSLYTRSTIIVELARKANKAKKQNKPLSLIFLKVDKYTDYEKDFGVIFSEEIIKIAGRVIQSAVQEVGIAGRYSESVFLLILEDTAREEADKVANSIRKVIYETLFTVPRHVSISGGISLYDNGETISELIQRAAKKLTAAQRNGGNRII